MELEEFKNVWASLDERLNKQEKLKESIIKEMMQSKANKSVSKLLSFDIISLFVCLFVIPILIWLYHSQIHLPQKTTFIYTMFVIIAYGFCAGAFNIKYLMKMDFTKSVAHNFLYINKYKKLVGKEKIAEVPVILVVCFLCIYQYAALHVSAWLWAFLICGLISAILFTVYSNKKIYDNNIHTIQKSLEELKELEEE
jgi:glucan phosphoethanolaminetransferase (alkaline phosphatase superfamily)